MFKFPADCSLVFELSCTQTDDKTQATTIKTSRIFMSFCSRCMKTSIIIYFDKMFTRGQPGLDERNMFVHEFSVATFVL